MDMTRKKIKCSRNSPQSLAFKTEVCFGNFLKRFALFIGDKWIKPNIMENHLFWNSVVVKNRLLNRVMKHQLQTQYPGRLLVRGIYLSSTCKAKSIHYDH